ncbi:MAG: hypothetical protein R3248_00445 [Candidatus Promineifilaceae bacterium]|nr:hypothetical protein [Candidatus Promineifilaceae bacterium]
MIFHATKLLGAAAMPFQVGEFLNVPMWGWLLVALTGFLLLAFVVIVVLDWKGAGERPDNENE